MYAALRFRAGKISQHFHTDRNMRSADQPLCAFTLCLHFIAIQCSLHVLIPTPVSYHSIAHLNLSRTEHVYNKPHNYTKTSRTHLTIPPKHISYHTFVYQYTPNLIAHTYIHNSQPPSLLSAFHTRATSSTLAPIKSNQIKSHRPKSIVNLSPKNTR